MSDDINTGEGGAEAMPEDQAASFAALMEDAEAQERQAEDKAASQQQAALAEQVKQNTELVEFTWDLVGGLLPERVAVRYGAEQRARIAASGTALAIKRGWSGAEFMAKWGAECAFVAALVGPVIPVIIESINKRKEGQPEAAPGLVEAPEAAPILADQVPGSKTVTFGAPTS